MRLNYDQVTKPMSMGLVRHDTKSGLGQGAATSRHASASRFYAIVDILLGLLQRTILPKQGSRNSDKHTMQIPNMPCYLGSDTLLTTGSIIPDEGFIPKPIPAMRPITKKPHN